MGNGHAPLHTASGHILFQSGDDDGDLLCAPFDPRTLATTGPVQVVADIAERTSRQERAYAVSDDGTLAYMPPGAGASATELAWLDREGGSERIAVFDHTLDNPRLSPDGRRIAFREPAPNCLIHVHDLDRNTTTLITRGEDNHGLVWSEDGRSILTMRRVGEGWSVFSIPADGSADATMELDANLVRAVNGEPLRDGSGVLVASGQDNQRSDIGVLRYATGKFEPLLAGPADEDGPTLSPDGTVLAYRSDESGERQVYIRRFPELDQRIQVSSERGREPLWSRDGRTLYFRTGDRLMSVAIMKEPRLDASAATEVLEHPFVEGKLGFAGYDVTEDGSRIVVARTTDPHRADSIRIITDWTGLLRR